MASSPQALPVPPAIGPFSGTAFKTRLTRVPSWVWRLVGLSLLFLILRMAALSGVAPITHGDSKSYIAQYQDGFAQGFGGRIRSVGYPLFLRFAGHDLTRAVFWQRLIAALSWLALAWSFVLLFHHRAAQFTAFILAVLVSFALNMIQWDASILSESLSLSLLALLVASWIAAQTLPRGQPLACLALTLLAVAFAALRDAHVYALPPLALLLVGETTRRVLARPKEQRRKTLLVLALPNAVPAILLFTSFAWFRGDYQRSERGVDNVGNVLALRGLLRTEGDAVTLNQDAARWFTERQAMPAELVQRVGRNVYQDPKPSPEARAWLRDTGRAAWLEYLKTHPGFAWRLYSDPEAISPVGAPSVYNFNGTIYMGEQAQWDSAWLGPPWTLHRLIHGGRAVLWKAPRPGDATRRGLFSGVLSAAWLHEFLLILCLASAAAWIAAMPWRKRLPAAPVAGTALLLSGLTVLSIATALFGDAIEDWRHALTGLGALSILGGPLLFGALVEGALTLFGARQSAAVEAPTEPSPLTAPEPRPGRRRARR